MSKTSSTRELRQHSDPVGQHLSPHRWPKAHLHVPAESPQTWLYEQHHCWPPRLQHWLPVQQRVPQHCAPGSQQVPVPWQWTWRGGQRGAQKSVSGADRSPMTQSSPCRQHLLPQGFGQVQAATAGSPHEEPAGQQHIAPPGGEFPWPPACAQVPPNGALSGPK